MRKSYLQGLRSVIVSFLVVALSTGCQRRDPDKHSKKSAAVSSKKSANTAGPTHSPLPIILSLPKQPTEIPKDRNHGGILRVHLETEPPHLNPLADNLQTIVRVTDGLVYETLLQCAEGEYHPGLAEKWEVSGDRHRLLLKLKPGVRFHDERPFTALDVQSSLDFVRRGTKKNFPWHVMLSDIEGIDILPENEVRIRLTRPSDLTLRALCEIPILPAEPIRNGGPAFVQLGRSPVGTGPFRFLNWERGKRIKLTRNNNTKEGGESGFEEISFEIETDLTKALLKTRRGEIDILPRILESHYPEQVMPATLRDNLAVYRLGSERYSYVVVNQRRGALSNPRFREALSLLWDRKRFSDELYHGLAIPIGGPNFDGVKPDVFDPKKAAGILDSAGFVDTDGDGVREVGGEPIRFTFMLPSGAKTLAIEVRAYALELRKVGVLLDTVSVQEPTVFVSRIEDGDFELAALQWEGRSDEDPRLWVSPAGDLLYTGYRSDAFLSIMEGIKDAASPRERRPLLKRFAELLSVDRPVIFLYAHSSISIINTKVRGIWAEGEVINFRSAWLSQ